MPETEKYMKYFTRYICCIIHKKNKPNRVFMTEWEYETDNKNYNNVMT